MRNACLNVLNPDIEQIPAIYIVATMMIAEIESANKSTVTAAFIYIIFRFFLFVF